MHTSFHLAQVQIPNSDNAFLLQTLKGAIDIVPQEVALAVQDFKDSTDLLSEDEIKTLQQRGYLTERAASQELEQAHAVMQLSSKNFRRLVELAFRLPCIDDESPAQSLAKSEIEEIFSLASTIAGEQGMVVVCLEIFSQATDAVVRDHILEVALKNDYPIMPTVTIDGLDALSSWSRSEYFNQCTLVSDSADKLADPAGLAAKINGLFERQIHTSWTCKIDGMSSEQLEAVLRVREEVRRKYPNFVVCLLADDFEGTKAPGVVTVGGVEIPFMSLENETILRTLLRFILMPNVINYKPFFQPSNEKLGIDLAANKFTYEAGPNHTLTGDVNDARALLEAELDNRETRSLWEAAQSAAACLACKYALVCGRDWIGQNGFPDAQQCARSFERRIEQTLPLLLFILRGNWRPIETAQPRAEII